MKKYCLILLVFFTFLTASASEKEDVLKLIHKVNNYWQQNNTPETFPERSLMERRDTDPRSFLNKTFGRLEKR